MKVSTNATLAILFLLPLLASAAESEVSTSVSKYTQSCSAIEADVFVACTREVTATTTIELTKIFGPDKRESFKVDPSAETFNVHELNRVVGQNEIPLSSSWRVISILPPKEEISDKFLIVEDGTIKAVTRLETSFSWIVLFNMNLLLWISFSSAKAYEKVNVGVSLFLGIYPLILFYARQGATTVLVVEWAMYCLFCLALSFLQHRRLNRKQLFQLVP